MGEIDGPLHGQIFRGQPLIHLLWFSVRCQPLHCRHAPCPYITAPPPLQHPDARSLARVHFFSFFTCFCRSHHFCAQLCVTSYLPAPCIALVWVVHDHSRQLRAPTHPPPNQFGIEQKKRLLRTAQRERDGHDREGVVLWRKWREAIYLLITKRFRWMGLLFLYYYYYYWYYYSYYYYYYYYS